MNTYIISYDLRKDHPKYDEVAKYIKSHGTWARILESFWAIKADKTAEQIAKELRAIINTSDGVFVIKSWLEAAWSNVRCKDEWLMKNL